MLSPERINSHDARQLLLLARASIERGLTGDRLSSAGLEAVSDKLREQGASFVTLNLSGQLRGCIGHLEAIQPLYQDVIENARLAAFNDPRFGPLSREEFTSLEISISILSAPETVSFTSESDLLAQIRPGIDGLILEEGQRRGTFLPSVWETLPGRSDFLRALKQKAGLPEHYWSDTIQVQRYVTQYIA